MFVSSRVLDVSFINGFIDVFCIMAQWLRCWIPNPGFLCSKPLGGAKVNSAIHPSMADKMSTTDFWELNGKNKMSPRSGFSLEAVEPHP